MFGPCRGLVERAKRALPAPPLSRALAGVELFQYFGRAETALEPPVEKENWQRENQRYIF